MPRTYGRGVGGNAIAVTASQVEQRNAMVGRYVRRFGPRLAARLLARASITTYGAYLAAEYLPVVMNSLPPTGFRYCRTCVANIPKPANAVGVRRTYRSGSTPNGCASNLVDVTYCLNMQADQETWNNAPGGCAYLSWQIPTALPGVYRYDHIHTYVATEVRAPAIPDDRPQGVPVPVPAPRHVNPAIDARYPTMSEDRYNPATRTPYRALPYVKPIQSAQTYEASYDEFGLNRPRWLVPPVRITIRLPTRPGQPVQVRPAVVPGLVSSVGTGKPEVKREISAKARAGFRMAAFASEAGDVLEVLYRSLPPDVQARYGKGRAQMIAAVWAHWREIDPVLLGANFAINELGDMSTAARVGIRNELSQRAFGNNDLWRMVNFGGL